MPYCPECGKEVGEDEKFCSNCGASVQQGDIQTRGTGRKSKTSLNLDENVEGALCYLLMWITGIIFLLVEERNRFIRFHAMQSLITFLPLTILGFIFGALASPFWWVLGISLVFSVLRWLITIVSVILWIVLMIKAYQGERYKLPIVGDFAEDQI